MEKIRVGIVGLGEVAQITHLPILASLTDKYAITAVCDISSTLVSELGKRYQVQEQYGSYLDLVSSPNIDLVFVLNSDEYHADTAIAGLENGKHVFIEKPVCLNLEDLHRIMRVRDAAKKHVMVGYMRRYAPAFILAKEMVKNLGEIKYARVRDIIGQNRLIIDQSSQVLRPNDFPGDAAVDRATRAREMVTKAIGEGHDESIQRVYRMLCGLSSHDLSAMRELLGYPKRVVEAKAVGNWIVALFEYDNYFVTFETGVDSQRRFDAHIEVYSNDKSIKVKYDTPYIRHLPTTLELRETVGDAYQEQVIRPTFKDPYTCELEHLYDVIVTDAPHKTTLEDSIADLILFQEIMSRVIG